MPVFIAIYVVAKYWFIILPIFIGLIALLIFLCRDSERAQRYRNARYYSENQPYFENPQNFEGKFSAEKKESNSSSDDPYDFGPNVDKFKMVEKAMWVAEGDPDCYEDVEI